jgi:hypothetical protein
MVQTGPIRGDFPSLKLGRMVRYGSTIERDLLYFLEYKRSVTWYQEQPFTVEQVLADGKLHRYTPDYEIHEGNGRLLVECKPEARLESAQAQQQRQIGQAWAENNGYRFVTYTETELRSGQQLNNLKLFWRYARLRELPDVSRILEHVSGCEASTVERVCQQLQLVPSGVIPQICHLLFHLQLHMELSQAFTTNSPFWLAEG